MSMQKTIAAVALVAGLGIATAAQAGNAHYTFEEVAPGTWEVSVEVTGADTTGLSTYGFNVEDLAGQAGALTWSQATLTTLDTSGNNVGFTNTPLASVVGGAANIFSAANDQGANPNALAEFGKDPIFVEGLAALSKPDLNIGVPAFIGTLTGLASTDAGGPLTAANFLPTASMFTTAGAGGGFLPSQDVTTSKTVMPIPEPASFALMGLGGLMLIRRRR